MRLTLFRTALIASLLCLLASTCPSFDSPDRSIAKRWYGVGRWDHNKYPTAIGPWPIDPTAATQGEQPLRYCFTAQSDYDTLNPIVQSAIPLWKPSFAPFSALNIRPDNPSIPVNICGAPGVRKDALQIQDATGRPGAFTFTNVGYDPKVNTDPGTFHLMVFVRHDSQLDANGKTTRVGERDRLDMAHEMGHSLGLDHEHQRPDRDQYIEFRCFNLLDYNDVNRKIKAKAAPYQEGDTITLACTDFSTARRYGFSASQYMRRVDQHAIGEFGNSKNFDPNSIMMYPSYAGAAAPSDKNFPLGATLVGLDKKKKATVQLYMGGKAKEKNVLSASEGDNVRIAQLYPIDTKENKKRKKTKGWEPVFGEIAMAGPA